MEEAPKTIRQELRGLAKLTGPLLLTQLGSMMLGVVDTAVVGRYDETTLAAVGLGAVTYFTIVVLGFGWMLALDPLISQAIGAGEGERAKALLWQGLWVASVGCLPLIGVTVAVAKNVGLLGVPPEVAPEFEGYLLYRVAAILPFLCLAATRSFLQALEDTRPLVIGVVIANVMNLPLSYALVFGELGLPELGARGAGVASAISTTSQLLVAAWATRKHWGSAKGIIAPVRAEITRILKLGTPVGLQLLAEVSSFAIVGFLMGRFGTLALGGHNVVMMSISFTFQLAVALGAAAAVRVGHAVGRDDTPGARRSGLTAIGAIAVLMIGFSIAFTTIPHVIVRVFTDDVEVMAAAIPLYSIAAAFQLSDGVQNVAAQVLRGAGDTRISLIANLIGHYAIGVPAGIGLAFGLGWGPDGLWWGLSAGLTVVAFALAVRFARLTTRRIERA